MFISVFKYKHNHLHHIAKYFLRYNNIIIYSSPQYITYIFMVNTTLTPQAPPVTPPISTTPYATTITTTGKPFFPPTQ